MATLKAVEVQRPPRRRFREYDWAYRAKLRRMLRIWNNRRYRSYRNHESRQVDWQ